MNSPHILLCTGSIARAEDVRQILDSAGFHLSCKTLPEAEAGNGQPVSLVLLTGPMENDHAAQVCKRLRVHAGEAFLPVLFVSENSENRQDSLDWGADTVLARPFQPKELLAQIQALLRIKTRHDQLTQKAAEVHRVNKRLQDAYQQIDQELELARRIQESFLPQNLPQLPQVEFAVAYKPCGRVGGDFYDVFRLDENHIGFYVADAMGHGVPASLLTIFVKKGVKAKEISGKNYRLVPPNEVLQKLNRDLIDQALSENPFITMQYLLLDVKEGRISYSRAGHPYPLYLPKEGPPSLWQQEGSLLGVFDVQYRLHSQNLQPGDKLLIYTDGIDAAGFEGHPIGLPSLIAAAQHFRDLPIQDLIQRLAQDLFSQTKQNDDLTILGIEMK